MLCGIWTMEELTNTTLLSLACPYCAALAEVQHGRCSKILKNEQIIQQQRTAPCLPVSSNSEHLRRADYLPRPPHGLPASFRFLLLDCINYCGTGNVALSQLLRDRGDNVDIFKQLFSGIQHVVPSRWRDIHKCWRHKSSLLVAVDQCFSLAMKNNERLFVLARRVPSDGCARLETDKATAHPGRLRYSLQECAIAAGAVERNCEWNGPLRFGRGGYWRKEEDSGHSGHSNLLHKSHFVISLLA